MGWTEYKIKFNILIFDKGVSRITDKVAVMVLFPSDRKSRIQAVKTALGKNAGLLTNIPLWSVPFPEPMHMHQTLRID